MHDLFGDSDMLLAYLLCIECIHSFGIDPEKVQPSIEDEKEFEKKIPYMAPVCVECLADYKKEHPGLVEGAGVI
jgi:hypothetical protein